MCRSAARCLVCSPACRSILSASPVDWAAAGKTASRPPGRSQGGGRRDPDGHYLRLHKGPFSLRRWPNRPNPYPTTVIDASRDFLADREAPIATETKECECKKRDDARRDKLGIKHAGEQEPPWQHQKDSLKHRFRACWLVSARTCSHSENIGPGDHSFQDIRMDCSKGREPDTVGRIRAGMFGLPIISILSETAGARGKMRILSTA